jgi:hypothetical protein
MNWQNFYRVLKSDYLKLLPIMGLAFYVAFIPHQSYPYPVHIDEWFHIAFANEVMGKAHLLNLSEPFLGGAPVWNQYFELGFHVFFGVFQKVSALPWFDIVRYFPSLIFMMTVLSAYVLAQRQGFGWQAALFTCLIPTTIGVLGPAFLVPVALGLLFIPLSMFLVFNFRTIRSYFVLFIFTCFLVSLHAATVIGLAIIIAPFLVINLKSNFKHSLVIIFVFAVSFLATFPWVFDKVVEQAKLLLHPAPFIWWVEIPRLIQTYGYPLLILCLIGTFLLVVKGDKRNYGLILGLLALLVVLVIYYTFHYGISTVYERGLVYAMLIMGIVAGAGLMGVQNLKLPAGLTTRLKLPPVTRNIGVILCLAAIGLTLAITIPVRQHTPYYHMINQEDYEAFAWLKDNVGQNYDKAILDPWKAIPFTAITGKKVYTAILTVATAKDQEAQQFLSKGCPDTAFLRENGISIVYSGVSCRNPDLVEVRKNIYLLQEPEEGE